MNSDQVEASHPSKALTSTFCELLEETVLCIAAGRGQVGTKASAVSLLDRRSTEGSLLAVHLSSGCVISSLDYLPPNRTE